MKQISNKLATVLTVILIVVFTNQSFSQLREHVSSTEYTKYVGNLQNGINSDNVGLKISAIQMTALYQVTENSTLLFSKYKEEKDSNIKSLIAITLFMLGDSKVLAELDLDEKSILQNASLSIFAEMYKAKSETNIRNFATRAK